MIRIIFSIQTKDKRWLRSKANTLKISMAELIRRAIKDYRHALEKENNTEDHPKSEN